MSNGQIAIFYFILLREAVQQHNPRQYYGGLCLRCRLGSACHAACVCAVRAWLSCVGIAGKPANECEHGMRHGLARRGAGGVGFSRAKPTRRPRASQACGALDACARAALQHAGDGDGSAAHRESRSAAVSLALAACLALAVSLAPALSCGRRTRRHRSAGFTAAAPSYTLIAHARADDEARAGSARRRVRGAKFKFMWHSNRASGGARRPKARGRRRSGASRVRACSARGRLEVRS